MKKNTVRSFNYFSDISLQQACTLVFVAFALRALVFVLYIQPYKYYNQPDTPDYNACAYSLATTHELTNLNLGEPVFWRTPGYPLFLAPFYAVWATGPRFDQTTPAHAWVLWFQIILSSLLPLLVGILAWRLTHNSSIASLCRWWSVFHLGFVLSSTFLLSDALSLLPFTGFLIFLLPGLPGWKKTNALENLSYKKIIAAAVCLGIYTWIRPNGQFVSIMSALLLLVTVLPWKEKVKKIGLFLGVFFLSIAPWYARNYTLTQRIFFCPMSGAYLQTFCAPKIISRLTGEPLVPAIQSLLRPALQEWMKQRLVGRQENPIRYVAKELICGDFAWPIIKARPLWFLQDWLQEVLKSTFDLYSYQLVACSNNTYFYDPPQEFLSEKVAACLYKDKVPFLTRLIAWVELLFSLVIWASIITGLIIFVFPFLRSSCSVLQKRYGWLWLIAAFISGGMLWMTGGFGYARLRLQVEPLFMLVVSSVWVYIYAYYKKIVPALFKGSMNLATREI